MATFIKLPGSTRKLLDDSRDLGSVDKDEITSLTIRVRSMGSFSDLERKVHDDAKKLLKDRKYLSREEFAHSFGAREDDLDRVEHHTENFDLRVVHRSAAERCIVVKGRLGDLLNAFPANVHLYHHASGPYRGRQGDILIPADLKDIITGIHGFDTRRRRRSRHLNRIHTADGPGGDNGMPSTFFGNRYNFPAGDGKGQTIAIIELGGGFVRGDLRTYFKEIQVSLPKVSAVSVDHAGNAPGGDADGEVMLDIEVAGAVAPAARQVVYFGPNQGNKGFIDAISAAVHDQGRNPDVISISWGMPEDFVDQQSLQSYHELFVAAAAMGVTVCAASGDHGVADMTAGDWDGNIHVDHPAADDMVLACGGTQVSNDIDVVWNDETPFDKTVRGGGGWSGGGGISQFFPAPAYQQSASLPLSIANSNSGRGVPDIAMSATNYFTRVDNFEGASGGTSAVAPLMAGLVTLLNAAKGKNVGFLNPFLYANPTTLKDVTSGGNGILNTVQGYKAGSGWDACTGLGTPDGKALLAKLK